MSKQQSVVSPLSSSGKDKQGPVAYLPANAKTGAWRLERPVPDDKSCSRCGICAQYCPCGVITVEKEKGCWIDYEYCKGCGICAQVCPKKAMGIIPEPAVKEVL